MCIVLPALLWSSGPIKGKRPKNAGTTVFSRGLGVVVGMWTTPTLWKGLAEPFRSSCGVSKPFAVGKRANPCAVGQTVHSSGHA